MVIMVKNISYKVVIIERKRLENFFLENWIHFSKKINGSSRKNYRTIFILND